MIFSKLSCKNKRFPLPSNLGVAFVERPSNLWAKQSTSVIASDVPSTYQLSVSLSPFFLGRLT